MTLAEAAKAGISRVRRPVWAIDTCYAKIDIFDGGTMGPWLHLYDRGMQNALGLPTPQDVLCVGDSTDDYVEYTNEIDPEDS